MIVNGNVIGYQIFRSGAAQLFVSCSPAANDKIRETGHIVRPFWQGKGTYDFDNPPDLLGARVMGFVSRNGSEIVDMSLKGGDK